MSPIPVSLFPLSGTTHTTVCVVVSSLDEDSSDEEYSYHLLASLVVPVPSSCFVASRGVLPPLYSSSVSCLSFPPASPIACDGVGLKSGWVTPSAALFVRPAPPRVISGARDFLRIFVYLAPLGVAFWKYVGVGISSVFGTTGCPAAPFSPRITILIWL